MYYLKPHWRQQNNVEHAECELEEEDEASHHSKAPERFVLRSPDTRQKPRDQHCCYQCCSGMQSEEHTSELQSLRHLVCRLLLEKKKKKPKQKLPQTKKKKKKKKQLLRN